jgi:hypothetical protein
LIETFKHGVERVVLSLASLVLGAIPVAAAYLMGRWGGTDPIVYDNVLKPEELSLLIAFLFLLICACANFALDFVGHLLNQREHGRAIVDHGTSVLFVVVFLSIVYLTFFIGALFEAQFNIFFAVETNSRFLHESKVIDDLRLAATYIVLLVLLSEQWLAHKVLSERKRQTYLSARV